eukprot:8261592-Ditylum_brightwellii.AAC.1
MGSIPTTTTASRICEAKEAVAQAQINIDKIEVQIAAVSTSHMMTAIPDTTPVELSEIDEYIQDKSENSD